MADPAIRTRTLVIGLGNPILGDDGVGWRVADAVERRLADGTGDRAPLGVVEVDRLCVGGLGLMERVVDHDRAVIVDAVVGEGPLGTVWSRPLASVETGRMGHLDSSHDASLGAALAAARALGARLPDVVTVVGVSIEPGDTFGERLSPDVERAVVAAAALVLEAIAEPAGELPIEPAGELPDEPAITTPVAARAR